MRCALALALAALAGLALARTADPSVRVHLRLAGGPEGSAEERDRIRALEYELMSRLDASGAGRLVRDEWSGGACVLHLEGRDAAAIWAAIEPAVRAFRPLPGSYAILRHGGPGAREERVEIDLTGRAAPPRERSSRGPTPARGGP